MIKFLEFVKKYFCYLDFVFPIFDFLTLSKGKQKLEKFGTHQVRSVLRRLKPVAYIR